MTGGEGVDALTKAGIANASTTTDTDRFASAALPIDVIGEASSQTTL